MPFVVEIFALILLGISYYNFYNQKAVHLNIVILCAAAFLLRIFFIELDPFLQNWDERFHALVAKNLGNDPLLPLLHADPLRPYNFKQWCCNHVWLHKQPLFLWQMALSIKLLGNTVFAVRLPSAIMGAIQTYLIYDTAKHWIKCRQVAYISAFLFTLSFYQLGLSMGRFQLGQNDVAFCFYIAAAFWAFIRYCHATENSEASLKWVLGVGVFSGFAVLTKWLTGLWVLGLWGLSLLIVPAWRTSLKQWFAMLAAAFIAGVVFIPWQIYTHIRFPLESAYEADYNRKHIFEAIEGQSGDLFFHLIKMQTHYGKLMLPLLLMGMLLLFMDKRLNQRLNAAIVLACGVFFGFFSIVVMTKMPSFTYPLSIVFLILIALCIHTVLGRFKLLVAPLNVAFLMPVFYLLFFFCLGVYMCKPWNVRDYLRYLNERKVKIHNTKIFKQIPYSDIEGRIVINCKNFEQVELMFYQNGIDAYHWYPTAEEYDSLRRAGHCFAAFKNHNNQVLPPYVLNDSTVVILDYGLR